MHAELCTHSRHPQGCDMSPYLVAPWCWPLKIHRFPQLRQNSVDFLFGVPSPEPNKKQSVTKEAIIKMSFIKEFSYRQMF